MLVSATLVLLTLHLAVVAPSAQGGVGRASQADELASRLAARVPQLMDAAVVPGVQLAVIRDGALAWQGVCGLANAQPGARATHASVFEAASLTKPLFACAVLKLVDEGRLDVDSSLVTYLPGRYDLESNETLKLVTARHVLSHRTRQ